MPTRRLQLPDNNWQSAGNRPGSSKGSSDKEDDGDEGHADDEDELMEEEDFYRLHGRL